MKKWYWVSVISGSEKILENLRRNCFSSGGFYILLTGFPVFKQATQDKAGSPAGQEQELDRPGLGGCVTQVRYSGLLRK